MGSIKVSFWVAALACLSVNVQMAHSITYVTNPGDEPLVVVRDREAQIESITNPGTLRSAIQTIESELTTPPISIKNTAESIYLEKPLPTIFTDLTIESSTQGSSRTINTVSSVDPLLGYLEVGGGQTTLTPDVILNHVNADISGNASLIFQGLGNGSEFNLGLYGGIIDFNFCKEFAKTQTYSGDVNVFYDSQIRLSSSAYQSPQLKLTGNIQDFNIGNPVSFSGESAVDGSIVLSGNNSWSGGSIIDQLELIVLSSGSFPTTGTVLYKQGSLVFNLPAGDVFNSSLYMAGEGTLFIKSGTLAISGNLRGIEANIQNGSLNLSGENILSKVVLGTGGSLEIASFTNLGPADLTFSGGSLHVTGNVALRRQQICTLNNTGSTITVDSGKTFLIPSLNLLLDSNTSGSLFLEGSGSHVIGSFIFGDVQNTICTLNGVLTGSSGLTLLDINGTNTLALSGLNTYTGDTFINGGTLLLKADTILYKYDPGNIAVAKGAVLQGESPTVYIDADISVQGTFKGEGIVFGTVSCFGELGNLAVIYPGNSIGEIMVGNANFGPYSNLDIYVDPTGTSIFNVIDSLVIDPSSILSFDVAPQFIERGTVDTFLSWDTLNGEFATVEVPSLWLTGKVNYEEDYATVTWDYNKLSAIAKKGNAHKVAQAIDRLVVKNEVQFLSALGFLIPATAGEIVFDLNQMQPSLFKAATLIQQNSSVKVQDSLTFRMQKVLDTTYCSKIGGDDSKQQQSPCQIETNPFHIWIDGLGDSLSQGSLEYASSPQVAYHENMGGFVSGIDYRFCERFYVGVLGGYTRADLHFSQDQGKGRIKSGYAGVYASALGEMFYGNASCIESWSGFNEYRHLFLPDGSLTASNTHGGKLLLSHIDTGLNLGWKGLTIRPFDSFNYITGQENAFTETGAHAFNLSVDKSRAIMLRNELGLNVTGCFCVFSTTWTVSPKISWVREVRIKGSKYQVEFVGTDVPFDVTGYLPTRNLISPGVSLTGSMLNDFLSFTLHYNGEFTGGYSDHSYGGELRFGF